MIQRRVAEPTTPEWQAWRERARQETLRLIDAAAHGQAIEIDDALYKAQKQWLMDVFNGKCAYCEAAMIVDQTGDIEHFRPKKAVWEADGKPVRVVRDGQQAEHPGYYWLAYDWQNLLPSCMRCNRPNTGRGGEAQGKRNYFPVDGFRASAPGEETREHALLLNPLVDNPERHFIFDENGIVAGITEEGRRCERVLGLNREGLPEARRRVYDQVRDAFRLTIEAAARGDATDVARRKEMLERFRSGVEPYCAIGRAALEHTRARFEALYGAF